MVTIGVDKEEFFTAEDAITVVRKLQEFPTIVLVGGQALNFWAEQFSNDPDIKRLAPYQSEDIDFLAKVDDVEECAKNLGGRVVYPSSEQVNTPQVGIVHCLVNGKNLKIDFLGYVAGPTTKEVIGDAVRAEIDEGVVLTVMHPINVLQSRIANVIQLRRTGSLSLRQLQTSIYVARAYVHRAAQTDNRIALDLLEELFNTAMSPEGISIWLNHGIDIFEAVRPCSGLPHKFFEVRFPQMNLQLEQKRKKRRAHLERYLHRRRSVK